MTKRTRNAFRMQLLPLIAGFAVLALLVAARSWMIEQQRDDNIAVRDTFQLEISLGEVLSLIQTAETGQRGYLLSGNEIYLKPYEHAIRKLPAEIELLENAQRGDPRFALLQSSLTNRLSDLARVIDLHRGGDTDGAIAMVRTGAGLQAMDRIRTIIGEMRDAENRKLTERLAASEARDEWLRVASVFALGGILALGFYGLYDARRRMNTILTVQHELETTNEQLRASIASQEAAETQVRQMQKMEAIGSLTGGIAHDFNNMLAVILGAMSLIKRKLAKGDHAVADLVDSAIDAADRAANLTARLLAFSRQQPLSPSVVDANKLVSGLSDMLRRTLGETIQIETVLAGGLWKTHADTSQLENAILNLAVNARDAMPDGGKLTIETANCHLDDSYSMRHADVPAGQYVLVAVTDCGEGMTPEVMNRAFDPFFTTKGTGKGTGLGLSQVFGFVKQTGGHVKIYSEPGDGTSVKIYLPRHLGTAEAESPMPDLSEVDVVGPITVLVVEDEERVRAMSVEAMHELGHHVIEASCGEEALERLASNPAITLLFTDIVMPGMTGRQLAEEATRQRPDLKVIFTTGFTRNAIVHNGVLDHGVNFLAKPFTLHALSRKIREALRG